MEPPALNQQGIESLIAVVMALGFLLPAAASAQDIGYKYSEGGYANYGGDIDADGLRTRAAVMVGPAFFGFAGYQPPRDGGRDFDTAYIGLGLLSSLNDATSVYGGLSVEYQEVRPDTRAARSRDDTGGGLRGGLRHRLTRQVALGGEVRYVDVGGDPDDYLGFTATMEYFLNPDVGLVIEYDNLDGDNGVRFGARYNF